MNKKEIIGIGLVLFLLIFVLDYHCPFYSILGITCPGCGMSRSFISFLKGDFYQSFQYHPMLVPTGFFSLFCIFFKKDRMKVLILWSILMILTYLYRLIFGGISYNWHSVLGRILLLLK